MTKALGRVGDSLGLLAGGFGIYQMISFESNVIKAAASLENLSHATGLSVEALSAIGNEAVKSGSSLDFAASAFEKLERNISLAASGNKKMTDAFTQIGISAKQIQDGLKDPDAFLLLVAQHVSEFKDGIVKTANEMTLFGKGGAEMSDILRKLAIDGYGAATATAAQAEAANKFETRMASLMIQIKATALTLFTEFIPAVEMATTTWQMRFANLWVVTKGDFDIYLENMKSGLSKLGDWILKATVPKSIYKDPGAGADTAGNIRAIQANADAQIAANNKVLANEKTNYKYRNDMDAIVVTAKRMVLEPTKDMAPAPPPAAKLGTGNDGLIKAMDERLKIVTSAMKTEDAATKLGNVQLDADYKNGIVSLADYGTQKIDILEKNFTVTQSLYDAEISLAGSYATQIAAKLAKEQAQKVDPTQAAQMAARIAATQAELDQATAKIVVLTDEKAQSSTKHLENQVTATSDLIDKSTSYAKTLADVELAYATMNGDATTATALQLAQQDGMAKMILLANGQTEAYQKLIKVEQDAFLRSSPKAFDGMKRSMIDYQKGLMDVAKATEAMTSKMLSGMEDALVSFVMTGKLDFKSLINSMIADMARLIIQQQVMGGLSKWLRLAVDSLGGASTAVTYDTSSQMGDMASGLMGGVPKAAGGPVYKGQALTVGERGPERFVPSAAGTIIPNGATAGGMQVTYAPVIQIDSRADRGQVQADTISAVRQGQKELLMLLRRYNPGLRV